jgi:hypothetical protein
MTMAEPGTQKQQQAGQAAARWRAVIMLQLDSIAFAEPLPMLSQSLCECKVTGEKDVPIHCSKSSQFSSLRIMDLIGSQDST